MDKLQEIKERWQGATPGPWQIRGPGNSYVYDFVHIMGPNGENLLTEPTAHSISGSWSTAEAADGTYEAVAAAPEDVAWLIAEVERLRGLVQQDTETEGGQVNRRNLDALEAIIIEYAQTIHPGPMAPFLARRGVLAPSALTPEQAVDVGYTSDDSFHVGRNEAEDVVAKLERIAKGETDDLSARRSAKADAEKPA